MWPELVKTEIRIAAYAENLADLAAALRPQLGGSEAKAPLACCGGSRERQSTKLTRIRNETN